ncbi:MAG: glycosyl transferase family protein [Bryobacteraceae bacterium]
MTLPGLICVWPYILGALAGMLLLSGLDDFVPLAICFWGRRRTRGAVGAQREQPGRKIAIFTPCWREAAVIEEMICDNIAAIRYRNYDFFLGVYPNDEPTIGAARRLAAKFGNVHVAVCARPGPTSKADCLNEIYRGLERFEQERGVRFDTVVLHDAEDVIHPEELSAIDRERSRYDMVQTPVLPLATPARDITHGVYCDEFSEYQTIDMRARQFSGSFVPSNGVGTGFAREILDRLAAARGCVFDSASLTEDYEIGVYAHQAGFSQLFIPLKRGKDGFLATREYFPRTSRSAVRQRTRWATGIALQCWERTGWRGSWRTRYWFWRDRKVLAANPLSFATNLLFTAGVADWIESAAAHRPWAFAVSNPNLVALCWLTLVLQCFRLGLRMICVAHVYGTGFALGVPLRSFHANFINCLASFSAVLRYANARLHKRPHVWLKTEHAYPDRALAPERRDIGDVLVARGCVSEEDLARARKELPEGIGVAELLLMRGLVSDEDLCTAISVQSGLPNGHIDPQRVDKRIMRSLPRHVERRFGVLPFAVKEGRLRVTGPEAPPSALFDELKSFTRLPVDFQLVTRRNYEELRKLLDGITGSKSPD